MEIKDIKTMIKILSAESGVSMAELSRRADDTPQGLNQRFKMLQKCLDYLVKLADGVGYDFVFEFRKK